MQLAEEVPVSVQFLDTGCRPPRAANLLVRNQVRNRLVAVALGLTPCAGRPKCCRARYRSTAAKPSHRKRHCGSFSDAVWLHRIRMEHNHHHMLWYFARVDAKCNTRTRCSSATASKRRGSRVLMPPGEWSAHHLHALFCCGNLKPCAILSNMSRIAGRLSARFHIVFKNAPRDRTLFLPLLQWESSFTSVEAVVGAFQSVMLTQYKQKHHGIALLEALTKDAVNLTIVHFPQVLGTSARSCA